jgi:uncharacterized membrane protein
MIGVGGLALSYTDFVMEWTNVPDHLPARAAFAYVHAALLILAGMGLLFDKTVRTSALMLELVWLVWTLLRIPLVIANWRTLGNLAEVFAITSGFLLLAGIVGSRTETKRKEALAARYCFAICMPAFGVVHFLYPSAVATWVPAWLPGHMFWAYFTGVAHCAAGLAIFDRRAGGTGVAVVRPHAEFVGADRSHSSGLCYTERSPRVDNLFRGACAHRSGLDLGTISVAEPAG